MNILFEIADRDLIIIGIIFVAIIVVALVIFKVAIRGSKVKPISEDERFDSEDNEDEIKFEKITERPELTDEQKAAKEELERVYQQMSMDLEKQEEKSDDIDEFEREQEENAIISYQELMAQAERLKQESDRYEEHAESNADIKVNAAMDTYKEHTLKNSFENEPKKESHGFKNSDIISPIYGIQREGKKSLPKKQSNGIIGRAYEEDLVKSEKKQNIDFLNSLKEFRKNL